MTSICLKEVLELAVDDEIDAVTPASHLYEDLGLDSMAAVTMVIEIQRRTGLVIPEDEIPTIMTVEQLSRSIEKLSGGTVDVQLR